MVSLKTPRDAVAYVPDGEPRIRFKTGELKSDYPSTQTLVMRCSVDGDSFEPRQPYKAVPVSELGTRGPNGEWVPLVPVGPKYIAVDGGISVGGWIIQEVVPPGTHARAYGPPLDEQTAKKTAKLWNGETE